jgi:redox-sensitive bicupin YhaK (pirin superfamily)
MTAGAGIQHSEESTPGSVRPHGVQLWTALPDAHRHVAPFFEHDVPAPIAVGDATLRVFVGALHGATAAITTFSPLVGAQLDLPAGGRVELAVDPSFEHGLLVDAGTPTLQGAAIPRHHLGFVPVGSAVLTIAAGDEPLRALLIGGVPLGESILMWWNFVGRTHEEIVAFRERWQHDVVGIADKAGRFGWIEGWADGTALPAPELPNVRLRPRDQL